jgi:flagellin-like protein
MIKMMNKKAISPLLATVFLIAFAVSLAVVVINVMVIPQPSGYHETTPEEQLSKKLCLGVDMNIVVLEIPYVCYKPLDESKNSLAYVLKNIGDKQITSLKVSILGSKGSLDTTVIFDSWAPGNTLDKRKEPISYSKDEIGNILDVTFIPIIKNNGKDVVCSSYSLSQKKPLPCP